MREMKKKFFFFSSNKIVHHLHIKYIHAHINKYILLKQEELIFLFK